MIDNGRRRAGLLSSDLGARSRDGERQPPKSSQSPVPHNTRPQLINFKIILTDNFETGLYSFFPWTTSYYSRINSLHLFSMNHIPQRILIQMDMYNINIVSDLRTIYHDTNSMIFFTSAEMHISTRALLVEFGSV